MLGPPPKKCIFCGFEGILTNEHIISKRYHKFIPRTRGSYKTLQSVELANHSEFSISKRIADPRDWKVQCVCHVNCNNGWMRKLDDKGEPILTALLTGRSIRLDPQHQQLAATWAIMKAIVAEYEAPNESSVHYTHRGYLFRNRRPPKHGWAVWIGYFPREEATPIYSIAPFLYLPTEQLRKRKDPRATYYNGSITTYVVGVLFIQVIHGPKRFHVERVRFPPLKDRGVLIRVWPPAAYGMRDARTARNLLRDQIAASMKK